VRKERLGEDQGQGRNHLVRQREGKKSVQRKMALTKCPSCDANADLTANGQWAHCASCESFFFFFFFFFLLGLFSCLLLLAFFPLWSSCFGLEVGFCQVFFFISSISLSFLYILGLGRDKRPCNSLVSLSRVCGNVLVVVCVFLDEAAVMFTKSIERRMGFVLSSFSYSIRPDVYNYN